MDKQNVVSPYNGVWFNHKKKWSTDTYYSVDEHQKHDAKWKKADKEGLVYNSTYMKCPG